MGLFLFAFFMGGCTLSMEEWILAEEDRGKEEPYTVESDYGTITYQFNDSVLYVTDRIQENYLVRVEHDSILYFNGSIPKEWRPYVGMKLATGCSHLLPYGLNHRIISVEDVGGILKVVATRVSTKEVYKHLSYCIDADVVNTDLSELTEEEMLDYGFELTVNEAGDTIIMDWNEYDVKKGLRPAAAKRRSLKRVTRAEDGLKEENSEEGAKEDATDGTKKSEFIDFFFDTRGIEGLTDGISAMAAYKKGVLTSVYNTVKQVQNSNASKMVDKDFYCGFGLKVVSYQRAHVEVDEDQDYEMKYTDSWSEWTVKTELGWGAKNNTVTDTYNYRKSLGLPLGSFTASMKNAIKFKALPSTQFAKSQKSWNSFQIRVIITTSPIPIAFIASASVEPTIELNGCLCASFTYTTDKVRTGYIHKGKYEEEIKDKIIEEGKVTDASIMLKGSLKVGMSFRAAAGLEFAGVLGVTCGANVDTYLEASGSVNIGDALATGNFGWENFDGNVRFYSDFYGDIQVHVAPLGFHLWDKRIAKFGTTHLINWSYKFGPSLYFCSGSSKFGESLIDNNDVDLGLIRGNYQFKDLDGIKSILNLGKYYPAMKLYFGPISDGNWIYMQPTNINGERLTPSAWGEAEEGKTYYFDWIGQLKQYEKDDIPITEAHLVPALCSFQYYKPAEDPSNDLMIEKLSTDFFDFIEIQDREYTVDLKDPLITTLTADQIEGRWNDDYDFSGHEQSGYVSTDDGEHGGASVLDKPILRKYTFYTSVNVQGGTNMKEWGLKIYIFGPDGKKRLLRRKMPVNKLRSGIYTFVFTFDSDWGTKQSIDTSKQHLYFRVQPYWNNPRASGAEIEAQDAASLKKYPINWEMEDKLSSTILGGGKNSAWGTIDQVNLHAY